MPVAASQVLQVGASIMVSRGIDSTVTCCRSALMCAIIWLSELATPSLVLSSVPPAAAVRGAGPGVGAEQQDVLRASRTPPGGGTVPVAVAMFVSSVTIASMLRAAMPESARDLIAHSQPVAVSTSTATRAMAMRPGDEQPVPTGMGPVGAVIAGAAERPGGAPGPVGFRRVARLVAHATSSVRQSVHSTGGPVGQVWLLQTILTCRFGAPFGVSRRDAVI